MSVTGSNQTSTWRKTYQEGIIPIRGARFWPSSSALSVHPTPDPDQPGRKKKNAEEKRKKSVNEWPVKKKAKTLKRIMHCGICGEANYNSRFHKKVCYSLCLLEGHKDVSYRFAILSYFFLFVTGSEGWNITNRSFPRASCSRDLGVGYK